MIPAEDEALVSAEATEDDETSGTVTSEMRSFGTQEAARSNTLADVKHRCRNLLIEFIVCEYISGIVFCILVHYQSGD